MLHMRRKNLSRLSMSKITSSKADISVDLMSDVQLGRAGGGGEADERDNVIFEDVYEDML